MRPGGAYRGVHRSVHPLSTAEMLHAPAQTVEELLLEIHGRLAQAEKDLAHALTWGWRPGSTEVRQYSTTAGAPWISLSTTSEEYLKASKRFWGESP